MASAKLRQLRENLRALLEPVVARLGCELVALELAGSPRRPALRLYVDRPGGVSVDHCAAVSSSVGPVLDVADPFAGAYDLEVSSPGIERPVERLQDFERFKGFKARVKLASAEARRTVSAVLRGVDGDVVLLEMQGALTRAPLADIERCRLDLTLEEFERLGPPTMVDADPPSPAGAEDDQ